MNGPALLWLLTIGAGVESTQSFRATVDAVEVDVFVGRGSEAVEGLTEEDFLVYDNDVPQTVVTLKPAGLPVHAVLALDTSYSVRGEKLRDLASAVRVTLKALEEEDSAALVTFSNDVTVTRASDGELEPLLDTMDRLSGSGTTSMYDGIFVALKLAETFDHPCVVVYTDGEDRFSWLNGDQVLRTAMRSEAPVFTVATGPDPAARSPHLAFLSRLAETTGGDHHVALSPRQLSDVFAKVLARMRNRYVLTYFPSGKEPGWHSIRVRLRSGRADVRARRGYYRDASP